MLPQCGILATTPGGRPGSRPGSEDPGRVDPWPAPMADGHRPARGYLSTGKPWPACSGFLGGSDHETVIDKAPKSARNSLQVPRLPPIILVKEEEEAN